MSTELPVLMFTVHRERQCIAVLSKVACAECFRQYSRASKILEFLFIPIFTLYLDVILFLLNYLHNVLVQYIEAIYNYMYLHWGCA